MVKRLGLDGKDDGFMDKPRGVGQTCTDCKSYVDNHYCDFTCWHITPDAIIPEYGCMTYQANLGNFEQNESKPTIKICPCCGGKAEVRSLSVVYEPFIACTKCGLQTAEVSVAIGSNNEYKTKDELTSIAIKRWNRRH